MANNNALSFYVKFYEDAQHNIQGLVRQMQGELNNLTFHLKAKNVNISGLEEALKKIQPVNILDKNSVTKAQESINTIHTMLKKAFPEGGDQLSKPFLSLYRVLGELRNSLGSFNTTIKSGNLSQFTAQINAISTAMTGLNEKLEIFNTKFANRLGQGIGRGMEKQKEANRKMAAENEALTKQMNDKMSQSEMTRSYDKTKSVIAEVNNLLVGVRQNLEAASKIGFNTGNLAEYQRQLLEIKALAEKVTAGGGSASFRGHENPVGMSTILQGSHYDELKKNISGEKSAVEQIQKALTQLESLQTRLGKVSSASPLFNNVQEQINKIKTLKAQLTDPGLSMREKHTFINQYLEQVRKDGEKLVQQYEKLAREEAQARQRLNSQQRQSSTGVNGMSESHQRAAQTSEQLSAAQQRMAQAIASATGKAQHQSSVLGDLRSMATQYLSVWGAWNFAKEVANITGELELQQKSLEVIIGSAGQAQELFTSIKGLSQMSPYTFQDMLKSTRQLAAFGVETKDLYGTMKSLSDLGAGLNVDVQRLILAYGHVKSAGVLSGIQRRQFETAGINITGEIAKLYNERYERAGSDERVTNADIFKKITKREIGFEDVEQAIENLTSKGGRFYDMQLRQYETLGGKLRNLRNNYNIMLDEIGKSYMELLTGGVDAMNSMMENWRTWGALIKSVTAALVAAKVASLAFGKSMAGHRAAMLTQLRDRINAQHLAALQGDSGSLRQNSMLYNRRILLGMDYAKGINGSDMSRFQKIRAALYSNVAPNARAEILSQQNMGKEYIANIRRLSIMANSTKTMTALQGQWGLAFQRLRVSANAFFATMRAGFVSIATNPMMWIGAAIAGITALVNKSKELDTARDHTIESTKQIMKEDIENIDAGLNPIKNSVLDKNGNVNSLNPKELHATFQELDELMQKHDPLYDGRLFDIKQMSDEAEMVKNMIRDVESVREGKRMLENNASVIETANRETGYNGSLATLGIDTNWSTYTEKTHQVEQDLSRLKARIALDGEEIEASLKDRLPNVYDNWKKSGQELDDYLTNYLFKRGKAGWTGIDDDITEIVNNSGINANFRNSLRDLAKDLDGTKKKAEDVAKAIAKGFNPSGEINDNINYFQEAVRMIFNTEGSEVKDPELQKRFSQQLLASLPDEGIIPAMREQMYDILLKANLSEIIKTATKEGSLDPTNVDKDAIANIENQFNTIADALASSTPDKKLREQIKQISQNIFKDFKANPLPAIRDIGQAWKKVYTEAKKGSTESEFYARFSYIINADATVNTDDMWDKIDKTMDENRKKIEKLSKRYTVFHQINFNISAAFDAKALEAQLKKIINQMSHTQMGSASWFALDEAKNSLVDMITGYKQADKEGVRLESEAREKSEKAAQKASDKAQKARDAANRKREAAQRKAESEDRRQWNKRISNLREEISMISEARNEYKKWQKDLSSTSALEQVKKNFTERGLYGKGKIFEPGDLDNLEDFSKVLAKVEGKIKDLKKSTKDKDRLDQLDGLLKDVAKAADDNAYLIFKEKGDEMLSTLNSDLQKLLKQYESAKKVIDATGDTKAAANVSGIGEAFLKGGWLDNILESHLTSRFAALLQSYDIDASKYSIDYGKVIGLDDKGIEDYVKDLIGDEHTGSLVQAISTWLKEYKRQYDDVGKSAVDAYAKAASAAMDYESQLQRINSELKEQNDLIDRSDASPEQKRRAKGINDSRAEIKRLELGSTYKSFFDGIFDEPMAQLEVMRKTIEGVYARALRNGAISAEEYAKKIEEIDKVMREATIKNPESWWNNGFFDTRTQEQRQNEMRNRGNALYRQGSNLYQQALQNGDQKGANGALEMMQKGQGMIDAANKGAIAMAIIDKVVHGIDKAIQGTVKAFNYLKDALDALGMEIDTMATIGDYLRTIGEMSSHVTASWDSFKSGDYVGASVEAFGAITSLITGFARAHDNRLQRKIEDIQRDTQKMTNTLDAIRSLRERTLGYDNGMMRGYFASMYTSGGKKGSGNPAQDAMAAYYMRYSAGSGYQQELQLLYDHRDNIIEMYNLENKKKKKNKEALEEYQTQIAQLDEQIRFFTEDLAKELWGIDIKGWAGQIGDALMTAFENGTSAAGAFRDAVQDIMRGVVKNMMVMGIIEPAMEKLRKKLFGKNGKGGIFDPENPKNSMGATLAALGEWVQGDGALLMDAANEFFNGADDLLRQTLGYGLRENERSSNTTNSITSTASEETMGIVAGYLSRLSQDVSVMRIIQEMFANGSFPDYIEQMTSANDSISAIDRNTTAMMEMMRDGNGALYERVENMSRRLDNFANGIDRISVR